MTFGRPRNGTQRRRLAAILALLWGLYAVLGGFGQSMAGTPPRGHAPARARAAACVCPICHGIMRGGKHLCCCRTATPPTPKAGLTARCGTEDVPVSPVSSNGWPVLPLPTHIPDVTAPGRVQTERPGDKSAASVCPLPRLRPPRLS